MSTQNSQEPSFWKHPIIVAASIGATATIVAAVIAQGRFFNLEQAQTTAQQSKTPENTGSHTTVSAVTVPFKASVTPDGETVQVTAPCAFQATAWYRRDNGKLVPTIPVTNDVNHVLGVMRYAPTMRLVRIDVTFASGEQRKISATGSIEE